MTNPKKDNSKLLPEDQNNELEKALAAKRAKDTIEAPYGETHDEFARDIARAVASKSNESTQAALDSDPGYEDLRLILDLAYDQSAHGKGKERHAVGPVGTRRWTNQPILEISRMVGPGYAAGQVAKKVQEAVTMAGNGGYRAARAEALGAIVYAAALYKLLHEMETERN